MMRNTADLLRFLAVAQVPVEIETRTCIFSAVVGVYKRRNKDKYKQGSAWKQIPLRMWNESRGDWKYPRLFGVWGRTVTYKYLVLRNPRNRARPTSILVFIHAYLIVSKYNNIQRR